MNTATLALLRRSCAAVLLARTRERGGVLAITPELLAAWAVSKWTPEQVFLAAHDLAASGDVRLTTDADNIIIVTTNQTIEGRTR